MTRISFDIPKVETERLILREPREADLECLATFNQSERTRFIGGKKDRAESWRQIAASLGHWAMRGFGFWTVALKEDRDRMIGACGFIFREGWDEPELGWNLHDGFEGKGYAHEAVLAARLHGAMHLKLDGVISYIDPANTRSAALATRLGAHPERTGQLLGHEVIVYRHPGLRDMPHERTAP